ncbi:MAG: TetR family transcriptional regulator, partial [Actinobacteria bacterium]|nr:TetR family transcriptional regulator [Actinomycetota bacterium]
MTERVIAQSPVRPFGRDEVRDAVLDAAARHFAASGTGASLREIASDAGVNLGLIHRHFGNKDDLLRAVLAAQTQG